MSALDSLKAGAAGLAEKITGENPKLLQELMKLVQNMPGGVSGLMKQFQDKGLGSVASSLTGNGAAMSISPSQILQGFGSEKINSLAASAGLDPKIVPEKVASLLPKVMEKLAPAAKMAGVP
jgi:uncharacterized protein YidB (DUF937 family)